MDYVRMTTFVTQLRAVNKLMFKHGAHRARRLGTILDKLKGYHSANKEDLEITWAEYVDGLFRGNLSVSYANQLIHLSRNWAKVKPEYERNKLMTVSEAFRLARGGVPRRRF